ncbi:MAG: hypothetical protein ACR2OW_13115, partial [Methyloligellaceae bacterium]
SNELNYHPRGTVLCAGCSEKSEAVVAAQVLKAIAAGNKVVVSDAENYRSILSLKAALEERDMPADTLILAPDSSDILISRLKPDVIVFDGETSAVRKFRITTSAFDGPRIIFLSKSDSPQLFASERVISEDTTAAGGNASLLAQES